MRNARGGNFPPDLSQNGRLADAGDSSEADDLVAGGKDVAGHLGLFGGESGREFGVLRQSGPKRHRDSLTK
jgi:hypothetical protein